MRRRESDTLGYLPPIRGPRFGAEALRVAVAVLCVVGWVVGTAASATAVVAVPEPAWVSRYGAALLTVVFVTALTYRCGGRVLIWTPLVLVAIAATAYYDLNWMVAALSVAAAVSSSVLAVMITRPAPTGLRAIGEFLLAIVVASSGALAVAGWSAEVVYQRYNLAVLALALLLTLTVVWGLGAGLHGLGRRGLLLIVGGAVLLVVIMAYGTAVRSYGSAAVVDALDDAVLWMREHTGGVPRPAPVLIGFPALIWGISTRAHRRQGWWMCAFGVIGTGVITTSLASPQALPTYIGLSTLYSVVLGLAIGLAVRRFDAASTSGAGRRARRNEPAIPVRPEPRRGISLR